MSLLIPETYSKGRHTTLVFRAGERYGVKGFLTQNLPKTQKPALRLIMHPWEREAGLTTTPGGVVNYLCTWRIGVKYHVAYLSPVTLWHCKSNFRGALLTIFINTE